MRNVFVLFPYLSFTEIHPWMINQIKGFKKAHFKVVIFPEKKYKSFFKNFINLLIHLPKIIFNIQKADYLLLSASFLTAILIPFLRIFRKKIILSHIATTVYPSSRLSIIKNFKISNPLVKSLDRFSFQSSDYIFTYAYSIKEALMKTHHLKRKLIYVIETLVDTKLFVPYYQKEATKIKKKLGITHKDILLYHGQHHAWHGLKYFFEAVPKLLKSNPNFIFVMMGFPKLYLRKIYKEKILGKKNFIFPGQVAYEDLPKYIQMADLWFGRFTTAPYPSLGNCVVEALSCGKAVLIYNTPEHSRLLTDKKDVIFVKSDDPQDIYEKIIFYFKNKKNRKKLLEIGKNARRTTIKKFSVESFSKKIQKILN